MLVNKEYTIYTSYDEAILSAPYPRTMRLVGQVMDLSLYLEQQLKNRNWTYRDAYERTGLSISVISHIINGTRKPDIASLVKLSEGFNIPLWRVVEMAGYDLGLGSDIESLSQKIASLMTAVPEFRPGLERLLEGNPEDAVAILSFLEQQEVVRRRLHQLAPSSEE